jgi:hypothetical protein
MARQLFLCMTLGTLLSTGAAAENYTPAQRPVLDVVMVNRVPTGSLEVGTARARVRFIFQEAGIRIVWTPESETPEQATRGVLPIHVVVLGEDAADHLIAGDAGRLAFAIPSARRLYVHYDRVSGLAREHNVQPGWFLGVVIAHELAHVVLPGAGHADSGLMALALSPDPKATPAFTRREAQLLRKNLLGEPAMLAQR